MAGITKKNIRQLREQLVKNLTVDFFEQEEISAILSDIDSYDKKVRQKVLALCLVLSGASSSFVPNTLKRIKSASRHLALKDLERWITHAFDVLDSQGTDSFVRFTSKSDKEALHDFLYPDEISLKEIIPVLETFLRGISGMELKIRSAEFSYTDTRSVFLPSFVNRFEDKRKNYLIYKIATVHKWAQIAGGTLLPDEELVKRLSAVRKTSHPDISTFFRVFSQRDLALDLYNILEGIRLDSFLGRELPGLMRDGEEIRSDLFRNRLSLDILSEKTALVEGLYQFYLVGRVKGRAPWLLESTLKKIPLIRESADPEKSMQLLSEIYPHLDGLEGDYELLDITALLGRIEPEKVSRKLKEKRLEKRKKIEGIITKLVYQPDVEPQPGPPRHALHEERGIDIRREYLLIKGKLIEMNDDMQDFIREEGSIPGGVLVKGSDIGGAGCPVTLDDLVREEEGHPEIRSTGIKYDEWDYRRGGYKRGWCSLYEYDLHPGREPFVELTLQRYTGYVSLLRKRFELLKREPKLLRRQREGEHVDIDAMVEAFSDISAGLSPSENLFMRLDRQERNIAVLFLLDMSGSTKGWVNRAEKEALVLMCEALEALGDRYAIYGFSGVTHSRCDFYRIKGFRESYTEKIKKRIAGIEPKDYTRMGPPLRHSVQILNAVEARTKLLITLSDGKPEDWDAYKGDYGIEDTRRALIEAREEGIHPFCITIDREAQTYLPHMYGEAKYTLIDDVKKLPNKITEIYRMLTT